MGECVGGWVLGKWEWWWQVSGVGDWCVRGGVGAKECWRVEEGRGRVQGPVATQSNLQKLPPAKRAKIEVSERKYLQKKKKTPFC